MEAAHRVAVVVRPDLVPQVEELARRQHVWAVRTPETEEIAQRIWTELQPTESDPMRAGLTLFDPSETPEESLRSVLEAVELHHGEYSHDPPLSVIDVLGTDMTDTVRTALMALGFTRVRPSDYGFVALREAP